VSEGRRGGDSPLTGVLVARQTFNAPVVGASAVS
jgi:hypothetical protein